MEGKLHEWIARLRGHLERPPPFVRPDRRDDYRRHVAEALAVVERATRAAGTTEPHHMAESDWERVRSLMRAAAWCAYPEPETAVEEANPEPASGVREIAPVAPEPPVSLRKIVAFFKRAVNS